MTKTTEQRASSGRMSVPSPMTTAAATARLRRASTRTRRRKEPPSHRKTMDISSPEVANSHSPATTEATRRPSGNTFDPSRTAARRWTARPPVRKPAPLQTRPRTTEIHSSEAKGRIPCRAARVKTQRGSESTSTRSPTLKTRPWPAKRLSMMRKLMKASSSTQR